MFIFECGLTAGNGLCHDVNVHSHKGCMKVKKQPTEIRQNEIAQAALDLIGSRGMKGLRMAAIAKKVGIVPSGIYRHFQSKDEVIDAILDFIQHRFIANARSAARMKGDALTRLHALLMKHVSLVRENASIPVVIFSADVYTTSPRRRVKLFGIIESYLAEIAVIIEQGQREGTIRRDVEPSSVAVMFMGLIQPPTILWHLSAGTYDVIQQAEAAWPIFCRAVEHQKNEIQEPQ